MEAANLRASRRAHRAHLTRVFGKISPLLESDEAPNERNTATLQTALEQIEVKRVTISELDTTIRATIDDPSALETEILDTEEITFTIAEKITLIKAVLARPTPPLQPQSVQPLAPVTQPSSTDTPVTDFPESHPPSSNNTEQTETPQGHVNTFASISQNASRLPKLTLPIFGGDPLKWQTFWDS